MKKGLLFVISAPAGTGKTTLVRMLLKEFRDKVEESVSYTTRDPRLGEINGRDYHFIDQNKFEEMTCAGAFLESAKVFNHSYGTSKEAVANVQNLGKHVILVIDTQGALQLKGKIEALFIFIIPPNLKELENRLRKRSSESDEAIAHRLSWAEKEISHAKKYDYHIVNDNLDVAYDALRSILIAEEHRNR